MLFSIITAVYNNKSEISDALKSVAQQRGIELEHIIMDGGSTDGTLELVQGFQSSQIKLESSKDNGIYDALNKGVQKASGDVVGILHSDDIFADDLVLKDVLENFEAGYDGVYADLDYVSKKDITKIFRSWKAGSFNASKLKRGWMPPHPTLFLKKSIYEEIGSFDLKYRIAADYDFILRVFSSKKYKIAYLPRTIVKMRVGGESNKSLKNVIRKSKEDLEIASKHFQIPFFTLMSKNFRKIHQLF